MKLEVRAVGSRGRSIVANGHGRTAKGALAVCRLQSAESNAWAWVCVLAARPWLRRLDLRVKAVKMDAEVTAV